MNRFILCIVALLLIGCSKQDNESVEVIRFESKVNRTNLLRTIISFELNKEAKCRLNYWISSQESSRITIDIKEVSTKHSVEAVLLEPEQSYNYNIEIDSYTSPTYSFATAKLPKEIEELTNQIPHSTFKFDGYIHFAYKEKPLMLLINDKGKIVWYQETPENGVISSTFDTLTNSFIAVLGYSERTFCGKKLWGVDLYGNVVYDREIAQIQNPLIHHEVIKTLEGDIASIHFVEEEFDLTAQGGTRNQTVCGDGFSIYSSDGELKKSWSAFETISPVDDNNILKPDPEFVLPTVEDWLHANSLIQDKGGNFYISFNKKNQIWKIDGRTMSVVYRLGYGGDVKMDERGYCSHLHSVSVLDNGEIMILDNGTINKKSRALIYKVDESTKTADIVLDLAFEDYSRNQSSAYMMDEQYIIYGASMSRNISIADNNGGVQWKYKTPAQFFRSQYIPRINL